MTAGYVIFRRALAPNRWESGVAISKNDNISSDVDVIIDWQGKPVSQWELFSWTAYPSQGCIVMQETLERTSK